MAQNEIQSNDIFNALFNVIEKLETAQIDYMLTGSVAGFFWGVKRFTQDIDIVISLENITPEIIENSFSTSEYYIAQTALLDTFYGKAKMFNIIELASYTKIDLIAQTESEYSISQFKRRKRIDFFGGKVWVISPEDLVLSKLNWQKMNNSSQQRNDIITIIDLIDLDTDYINNWAKKLGTFELWKDLSTHRPKHTTR